MRLALLALTAVSVIAALPASAAPARGAVLAQNEARAAFTTRSPAGYVYRRVPAPPMPTGDVEAVEVTVQGRPDTPSNPRTRIGSMGAGVATSGVMSGGAGTNVAAPMSSNRQAGSSGF